MNNKWRYLRTNHVGVLFCAATLTMLTGCVGYVDGPPGGAYVQPPMMDAGFAAQDDYIYYPNYECYYSASRHQYTYREGNAWVSRSAPHGVSADVMMASPSVRMDFHDSPAQHHANVVKQYPKNWHPSGEQQKRSDDRHDDHADNHGK